MKNITIKKTAILVAKLGLCVALAGTVSCASTSGTSVGVRTADLNYDGVISDSEFDQWQKKDHIQQTAQQTAERQSQSETNAIRNDIGLFQDMMNVGNMLSGSSSGGYGSLLGF